MFVACWRDDKGPNEQNMALLWALYVLDLNVSMVSICSRWTYWNQQAAPFAVHQSIYWKPHTDEFTTVLLYTGDNKNVKRLCYATVHTLMVSQEARNMYELMYYIIVVILTSCMRLLYIVVNVACSLEVTLSNNYCCIRQSVFILVDIMIKNTR